MKAHILLIFVLLLYPTRNRNVDPLVLRLQGSLAELQCTDDMLKIDTPKLIKHLGHDCSQNIGCVHGYLDQWVDQCVDARMSQ